MKVSTLSLPGYIDLSLDNSKYFNFVGTILKKKYLKSTKINCKIKINQEADKSGFQYSKICEFSNWIR